MSIILFGFDDKESALINEFLTKRDVAVFSAQSINELYAESSKVHDCRGILVAARKWSKFSDSERILFSQLELSFPISKIAFDGEWSPIIKDADFPIETLAVDIKNRRGRPLRAKPRLALSVPVAVSSFSDFAPAAVARTINISSNGCALQTAEYWSTNEIIWLRFKDNEIDITCQAQICWESKHESSYSYGCIFLELPEHLVEFLDRTMRTAPPEQVI